MKGVWILALLLAPVAAATTPCECWSVGEAQDAPGDAAVGSDIVAIKWGQERGSEIVVETRGGLHTDLRWELVRWTHLEREGQAAWEGLTCFTVRPGNDTVEVRGSARPASGPACAQDAYPAGGRWSIRGGDELVIQVPGGGATSDGTTCSMMQAQVWRGDELLEQTPAVPERPAAGGSCPGSTMVRCDGHCAGLFAPGGRVAWLVAALALLALLRRR